MGEPFLSRRSQRSALDTHMPSPREQNWITPVSCFLLVFPTKMQISEVIRYLKRGDPVLYRAPQHKTGSPNSLRAVEAAKLVPDHPARL